MKTAPDRSDLLLCRLSLDDDEAGCSLSTEIGWNQTRNDWLYMLEHGFGDGYTDRSGRLIASAMALPYGHFGWVCMVLVSEPYRRRGLATELMGRVISELEDGGITPGLDATPAGREVYLPLGFKETVRVDRLVAERASFQGTRLPRGVVTEPMTLLSLDDMVAYDLAAFGADRSALLMHLATSNPAYPVVARRGEELTGFALAREGVHWTQIGPVLADDPETARALIAGAATAAGGPLLIDVISRSDGPRRWLEESGFSFQRPYHRMYRSNVPESGHEHRLFAIAGPEFG